MPIARRATNTPDPYIVQPSKQFDGNDGSWSTFKISVGTPGQDFRVLPSTKGGVTYVIAPDGCLKGVDPAGCQQLRGVDIFQSSQNIGFQTNVSSSWSAIGQYDVDLEQALNYTTEGLFGFDTLSLGPATDGASLSFARQVVAEVADPSYYLGVLPLGQAASSFSSLSQSVDSLLIQLRKASKIPSLSYAYTAGAKYRLKSVFGSLVLGGYDITRFKANLNDFSFTFSADPSRLLTVSVNSITATNTLKGEFSLTSSAHFSVIDSTVSHLWLPEGVCTQFESAFGLTYDARTDLYLVNNTIHQQLLNRNPILTIKLGDSPQDTASNYVNIKFPYAAFDLQASYPLYPNATNYFPIRRAANNSQYVLGRTLLQEAYLIVDFERANFKVLPAAFPDPLLAAKIMTITSPNSPGKAATAINAGAIAGIAIGAIALNILAILAFFFFRRRRARNKTHELAGKQTSEGSQADAPRKISGLHEVRGTPLAELASSHEAGHLNAYSQDQKTVVIPVDTPQELHAESRTPITPRWEEIFLPCSRDVYVESEGTVTDGEHSASDLLSSDDLRSDSDGPRNGVSPLMGQFPVQHARGSG